MMLLYVPYKPAVPLLGISRIARPGAKTYVRPSLAAIAPYDPPRRRGMESATATARVESGVADKGLKKNAIGFASNLVIGVASVAPGYSLAATLGLVAAAVGFQAPAIMIVAFLPMLCIAFAYKYMNRADPDCGTTFAWVTRALGPQLGWLNGWVIIVADVIVMANLAQIAGLYTFKLFDWDSAASSVAAVTVVGVLWIVIMTAIVTIGIELSARTQQFLLGAEVVTLVIFAVVALVKVYVDSPAGSVHPDLAWFSPFAISSTSALTAGVLIAVFIYWGWDSGVAVNEETKDSASGPGRAAVLSTFVLVGIYVVVSTAAQAFGGTKQLVDNSDDVLSVLGTEVFGSPLDKILIIAVLTSAAASTQTTILPTARTVLSMARWGAIPKRLGDVSPRLQTPHVASIAMGVVSIVWYVGLTIVSENILFDSIAALGLMIAWYYGFTGLACVVYYRKRLLDSWRNFVFVGVLPFAGGAILTWVFVKSCIDLAKPENSESGDSWLGLGPPLVIGISFLLLGVLFVIWGQASGLAFFRRGTETAKVDPIGPPAPSEPADAAGPA
jgi:amino acid transporter